MPKTIKAHCNHLVCSNKKWRRCRNTIYLDNKCRKHFHPSLQEVGKCCFCQGDCNPCSQACGRCARDMTMQMLGWK